MSDNLTALRYALKNIIMKKYNIKEVLEKEMWVKCNSPEEAKKFIGAFSDKIVIGDCIFYRKFEEGVIAKDYISKSFFINFSQIDFNERKVIGKKAPFDISTSVPISKGDVLYPHEDGYIGKPGSWIPKELCDNFEDVYEEVKIINWFHTVETSQIILKGKLTQEIVDRIKIVLNQCL